MAENTPLGVHWSAFATADMIAILDYIAEHNAVAAESLLETVESKIAHLGTMPEMGRIGRVAGTRELVLTPNYIAVYRHGAETVLVLRVLHAMQQWPSA